MPVKKRTLLETLSKVALVEFARGCDVGGFSTMSKPELVDALAGMRSLPLADVLEQLSRDELKAACEAEGLDATGKEKSVLIERLMGEVEREDTGKNAGETGAADSGQRTADVYATDAVETKYSARPHAGTGDPSRKWGPDNPHPLSTMKTELVWEGKYDEWGNRREVDIAGCAMPMQRIETIDQPRSEAAAAGQLAMFEKKNTRVDDFRNRLIWGDNKLVTASLLSEFKGRLHLIYIDPPFDVGIDFGMKVPIGDANESIEKDQSALEFVAFKDIWGRGMDSYLQMMYDRLVLMKDLLHETGTLYIHSDWHVGHFLKSLCAEIFGKENFVNEITWHYYNKMAPDSKCFPRGSDRIISFAKRAGSHTFNKQYERRDKPVKQLVRKFIDGKAINFRDEDGNVQYQMRDERRVDDVWRLSMLQPADKTEYLAYSTQKPESVVGRIVSASSNPGDLVADFFCGSGTTGAVAEKLGRRWIMADLGRFAIHTTRKRLIEVQRTLSAEGKPYRSFDVHNLGRYERQWWQQEALKGADTEHRRVVLEFFKAEILDPAKSSSPLIHGRKGRALCHVDGIDGIFTAAEARAVALAAAGMGATEVYCLAWDFEMDIRQRMAAIEAETGVKMYPLPIPKEIMERNRKDPPPWLEVAVVEAEAVYRKGGGVDIKLTKFLPSLAQIDNKELEEIRKQAVKSGFDFIDFWAVDFDWHADKPFNHNWQDYRTRKDRSLKTISEAGHLYGAKGNFTACVKVVDVFGCDTSIAVKIKL